MQFRADTGQLQLNQGVVAPVEYAGIGPISEILSIEKFRLNSTHLKITKQIGKTIREYLSMTFTSRTRMLGSAFRARLPIRCSEVVMLAALIFVIRSRRLVLKRRNVGSL